MTKWKCKQTFGQTLRNYLWTLDSNIGCKRYGLTHVLAVMWTSTNLYIEKLMVNILEFAFVINKTCFDK